MGGEWSAVFFETRSSDVFLPCIVFCWNCYCTFDHVVLFFQSCLFVDQLFVLDLCDHIFDGFPKSCFCAFVIPWIFDLTKWGLPFFSSQPKQLHFQNFHSSPWALKSSTSWWFQILFIFTPIWGNDPIWLIFFKWVEPPTSLGLRLFQEVITTFYGRTPPFKTQRHMDLISTNWIYIWFGLTGKQKIRR